MSALIYSLKGPGEYFIALVVLGLFCFVLFCFVLFCFVLFFFSDVGIFHQLVVNTHAFV